MQMIEQIYHEQNGVDGYRTMQVYLERKGKKYSRPTIHKYMNRELGLKSVTRRKKPGYCKGKAHRVFRNIPRQDFDCEEKIRNGVQISHICFFPMEANDITVLSLICLTVV